MHVAANKAGPRASSVEPTWSSNLNAWRGVMRTTTRRPRVDWRLPFAIVVAGYSWWATGLRPFTLPIEVAVGIPVLILLVLSWRRTRLGAVPAELQRRPPRSGLVAWGALFGALVAWELAAYVASPRQAHPTLSSITDSVTSTHPARALVFAVWVLLGLSLFLRRDRPETNHQ